MLKLVPGGYVINGPTPSSFIKLAINCMRFTKRDKKRHKPFSNKKAQVFLLNWMQSLQIQSRYDGYEFSATLDAAYNP